MGLLLKEVTARFRHVSSSLQSERNVAVRRFLGKIAKLHPPVGGFETWRERAVHFGNSP